MSGTVIRVIEDTHYDFSGLQLGGQQSIVVAQRIDVSQFRTASLLVRVIKLQLTNNSDTAKIGVYADPWDPFSGNTIYFAPTGTAGEGLIPLPDATLNSNGSGFAPPTDPYSMFYALNTPFGGLIQILLSGVRSGGAAGDTISVQLNADLILKD